MVVYFSVFYILNILLYLSYFIWANKIENRGFMMKIKLHVNMLYVIICVMVTWYDNNMMKNI